MPSSYYTDRNKTLVGLRPWLSQKNKKRPITFYFWRFGLIYFINVKNPSHQRHPFPVSRLSLCGFDIIYLFNLNQDRSQQKN